MDGLSRTLNTTTPITLGGRAFRLTPLTLRRLGSIELHLLMQRIDLIATASAPCLRELALADVRANKDLRVVRMADVLAWLDTTTGVAFTAWLCLRPRFDGLEAAGDFMSKLPADAIRHFTRHRDAASGFDVLSNLDWMPSRDADDPKGFIPWRRLFRYFAETFHWLPDQLADLTLYQLRVLRAAEAELGGRSRMSPAEALALVARGKGQAPGGDFKRTREVARAKMLDNWRKRKGGRQG